jgi:hypothetical protein
MNMISPAVPRPPALLNARSFTAVFCAWLQILEQRLQVGWEREILRTLDQGVREDLGLASSGEKQWPAGEAPKKLSGPLREVFSWTRFSK